MFQGTNMKTQNYSYFQKTELENGTLMNERLIKLQDNDPIPRDIMVNFHKKFPEKNARQLTAYVKGYVHGLKKIAEDFCY